MKIKFLILFIIASLFLTGCWDKVEVEDRAFILTVGIDKYEGDDKNARYELNFSLPTSEKTADKKNIVISSTGDTIITAIKKADAYSNKKLNFGHTKAIILGDTLLKDELLVREVLDVLERSKALSKKSIILTTNDSAKKIINSKTKDTTLLGVYIDEYFENNSNNITVAFDRNIETVLQKIETSGHFILPVIKNEDNEFQLVEGAVVKNFVRIATLNSTLTQGYAIANNEDIETQITIPFEDTILPLSIKHNKLKYRFFEEDNTLKCSLELNIIGSINEYIYSDKNLFDEEKIQEITVLFQNSLEKEILDSYNFFVNDIDIDGFNIIERLHKHDIKLYTKYVNEKDKMDSLKNIKFIVRPTIKINNIGSIK